MSYDVYLIGEEFEENCICSACQHSHTRKGVIEYFSTNYTSNMGPAWREAGAQIHEWDGKKASECSSQLAGAIAVIKKDIPRFKKFEPNNGWGHVDTMLNQFLVPFLAAMHEYPDAIVRVSK